MDDPAPPPSTFAVFKAFWETPPYGREAYDEWPSTALGLARAAYREDPPGFDAFLVEQIRSVGPTAALLIAEVSDAPAVTDALRARLPGAQAAERARIAELLAAKGHREEASDILLELLRGPERRHAAGPLPIGRAHV